MRIGAVPYYNAYPLTHFLPSRPLLLPPSEIAGALTSGQVDVALLPVYAIIKNNLVMHPEAGIIGCEGAVKSVGFFTRSYISDLSQIKTVYLDQESLTSTYLAKILLKKLHGLSLYDLEFLHADKRNMADAQMLIGDKALFFESTTPHQFYDMGQMWQDLTGMGFMFASWASARELTPAELAVLKQAKQQGLENLSQLAHHVPAQHQAAVLEYWQNNIVYDAVPTIAAGFGEYKSFLDEYHYSLPPIPNHVSHRRVA